MDPTNRSPRRWPRWLVICGAAATAAAVAAVVIAITAPSRPGESGAGSSALVPDGPVTLVRGARTINGVELGFPHTTAGAISAAASLASEVFTLDPGQAKAAEQLLHDSSYPFGPSDAVIRAESIRKLVGIPATGPVPAGYSAIFTPVEYQVRDATADEVMVVLLCNISYSEPGPREYLAVGVYPFLMHWEHGGWKDAGDTGPQYKSLLAEPDSKRAAELGWKVLRPPV